MSLVVGTNIGSLNAQRSLASSGIELKSAMERLSTGKRINSAADDAAGFAIAERMTAQIRGLNMAAKNANDGLSMLSVADAAADDITDMLQRMRELAVQADNGTNSLADRQYLQNELEALTHEIDRVATQTQYNGQNLLDGSKAGMIQTGSQANQVINFDFKSLQISSFEGLTVSSSTNSIEAQVPAGPTTDFTVPVLTQFSADKSVINVTNGPQVLNVDLETVDESGLARLFVRFRHTETGHDIYRSANLNGANQGSVQLEFDEFDHAGVYELWSVITTDLAGNEGGLGYNDLVGAGIDFSVEVVGGSTDFTVPVLTQFSADKSVINVTNGPQVLNVDLETVDESGLARLFVRFRHTETGHDIYRSANLNGANQGSVQLEFDEFDHAGVYELWSVITTDLAGNEGGLGYNDLVGAGIDFSVEVVGGSIEPSTTNQSYSWSQEVVDPPQSSGYTPTGAASQSYEWSQTADPSTGSSGFTPTGAASQSYEWSLYNLAGINLADPSSPLDAIATITAAVERVSDQRAEYGALQNRLNYTISNLMGTVEATEASRSRIEDADFAVEAANLAKAQVLQQAGTVMLAQANAQPQLVLSLIKS
ncbi:flagellin [Pseudomonadales bacterium]|nr:flagellin [Pseudomonadales bacterium]